MEKISISAYFPAIIHVMIAAVCISAFIEIIVIFLCKKNKWYDQTNDRKVHTGNIPRLGSIGFVLSFIICTVCYLLFVNTTESLIPYIPLIVSGFIIFVFGVIDDFFVLPARTKLVVQIIASLIVICSGNVFTCIGPFHLPAIAAYAITFCWLLGMINSFNLIDGVDALCGGIASLILGFMACIFSKNNSTLAVICILLTASLFGFLIFNKPKAKIFMGDGGSQFLGFIIATLPLCNQHMTFESNKLLMMIILASIPLIDTLAAIWRRLREHRPVFSPDKSHLHHKLLFMGFSVPVILLFLYTVQIILGVVVVVAVRLSPKVCFAMLFIALCFVTVIFSIIHYVNRALRLSAKRNGETVTTEN